MWNLFITDFVKLLQPASVVCFLMIDLSKERSVLAMSLWVKMRLILIPPCEPNLFWLAYFLSDALCCKALKCCNFYHWHYFEFNEFLFFLLSGLMSIYLTWYQRRNSFPFRSCIYVQFRYRVVLWIRGVYLCVCFLKCCVLVDWTILILIPFLLLLPICNLQRAMWNELIKFLFDAW